jgi:SAM-dependent methyltransferase
MGQPPQVVASVRRTSSAESSTVPGTRRRCTIVPAGFSTRSTTCATLGASGSPASTMAPGTMTVGLRSPQDVHEMVARELRGPVLDVGCGEGRLASLLGDGVTWIGVDSSPAQVAANPYRPVVLAACVRCRSARARSPR